MYRDRECTNWVQTLTTDANGVAESPDWMPLDGYYVKETKASTGFVIPKNIDGSDIVYYVDGGACGDRHVRETIEIVDVEEPEKLDPQRIIMRKIGTVPDITNLNKVSLGGAKYKVTFYDSYIGEVGLQPKRMIQGYIPSKTWYFNSIAVGNIATVDVEDISSFIRSESDSLFYVTDEYGNKKLNFPKGTLVYEEVEPPNGWLLNDKDVVIVYIQEHPTQDVLYHDMIADYPEQNLQFTLQKLQQKNDVMREDIPISGATFVHEYKRTGDRDWKSEEAVTGTDGVVAFTCLYHGEHRIYEKDSTTPQGYITSKDKYTFTVDDNNQIVNTNFSQYNNPNNYGEYQTPTSTVRVISNGQTLGVMQGVWGSSVDGCIEAIMYEQVRDFTLNIRKVSRQNGIVTSRPLAGAEYTVYEDEKCTKEVDKGITDSAGKLTFKGLRPYKTYWLKETKSPKGYNYKVNYGVDDYAAKLFVENIPQKNDWSVHINDKVYRADDSSTGLEFTYANKELGITFTHWSNGTFPKLPKTGSSMMIALVVCGLGLMGISLAVRLLAGKRKNP